jgi:hypothetical protein
MGYYLKNSNGEYVKSIDGAKLVLTKEPSEAYDYAKMPGGEWSANNEKLYINYHYGKEFGERVKTLTCVYEER